MVMTNLSSESHPLIIEKYLAIIIKQECDDPTFTQ